MTPNRCGKCRWYEPARNPDTGRPLPSKDGRCNYPIMWPISPKSLIWSPPTRIRMWRADNRPCACFEAKAKAKADKPPILDL
jgi:hypothetical protein